MHSAALLRSIQAAAQSLQIEIPTASILKQPDYCTFQILHTPSATQLKVDLVNDIAYRVGKPTSNPVLGQVDCWEKILTNKLGALFRFEAKDYANIWAISKHQHFEWMDMFHHARRKDAGLDPVIIAELLRDIPVPRLSEIKWMNKPDLNQVQADLARIATDVLRGSPNHLA
ncbi:MAG: hypothetical protein KDK39_15930 [Leptospiraceae bacterium]|nr:hypothetical protein [Leptospiraceae bacterium]